MKQEEKQQWTERVMNSANNLPPAAPERDMFDAIERRIHAFVPAARVIPLRTVSAAAAALLVLLAFNYFTVSHKIPHTGAPSDTQALIQFYQLNDDDVLNGN